MDLSQIYSSVPVNLLNPANRHHPLNYKREAWWLALRGLDGGRNFYDLMGLYPGVLQNMAAASGWRSTTRPGGWSHLLFDGTNDDVQALVAGGILTTMTVPFSVGCSVNFGSVGASSGLICKRNQVNNWVWSLSLVSGVITILTNNGSTHTISGATTVGTNIWYRCIATCDGTTGKIYLNGVQDGSGALVAGTSPSTIPVLMGCQNAGVGNTTFLNGSLDDLFISSRVWSASEVWDDYVLSQSGYPGVLNRETLWLPSIRSSVSGLLLKRRRAMA